MLVSHNATAMSRIAADTQQVAVAFTQNFEQGAQNAAGSINTLTDHIATKAGEMVSHIAKVAAAFGGIVSSANKATGAVKSLKSAIDSLKDKTVTSQLYLSQEE